MLVGRCAGDVAIEPRGDREGERGPVALENAFRGVHYCKSWEGVRGYLEDEIRAGRREVLPLDD